MSPNLERAGFSCVLTVLLVLAIIGLAAPEDEGSSQEAAIELTASVDTGEFPQNGTATLTITLRWLGPQEAFEIEPLSPPSVDNLRIVSSSSSVETRIEEGEEVTHRVYRFVLRGESQGAATVGRLEVGYRRAQTGERSFLETQPIQLQVAPPKAKREFSFRTLLLIVAALAFAALLFTIIRSLVKKPGGASVVTPEASPPTLEERLLEEVGKLQDESPKLTPDDFYSKVRTIALDYLQERHGVNGRSLTTGDLLTRLEQEELPPDLADGLRKVLLTCDHIRFGSGESSSEERGEILSLLRQIMEPER
jgi:hypothetical protein